MKTLSFYSFFLFLLLLSNIYCTPTISNSGFLEKGLIFSGFCGKIIKSYGGVKVSTGILKSSKRAERAEAL